MRTELQNHIAIVLAVRSAAPPKIFLNKMISLFITPHYHFLSFIVHLKHGLGRKFCLFPFITHKKLVSMVSFWRFIWGYVRLVVQSCLTLCNPRDCSTPGSSVHGHSPGKNRGVDCHALLQGIFPTQESNQISCIAGRFFIVWVTREAPYMRMLLLLLLSHLSCVWLCATRRRQPTRLPCPWDSPGKNTGVGCHFNRMQFTNSGKKLPKVYAIP